MSAKKRRFLIIIILAVLALASASARAVNRNKSKESGENAATPVESASRYDTSYLEAWCGEPKGSVRMLAGWYIQPDIIETEDGNRWSLNTESINPDECLLIWLDDMGTPETTDDKIIKVWSEVYD